MTKTRAEQEWFLDWAYGDLDREAPLHDHEYGVAYGRPLVKAWPFTAMLNNAARINHWRVWH